MGGGRARAPGLKVWFQVDSPWRMKMMVRSSTRASDSSITPVSPCTCPALYFVSFPRNMYFAVLM